MSQNLMIHLKQSLQHQLSLNGFFSAAGLFITKIRSRMGSKHVNALSTLRSYFCQKNNDFNTLIVNWLVVNLVNWFVNSSTLVN